MIKTKCPECKAEFYVREIETIFKPSEVGEHLSLSQKTVRELLKKGTLKGFKIGKEWRIKAGDLKAFIEKCPTNTDLLTEGYAKSHRSVTILKEVFRQWEGRKTHVDWSKPAILFAGWLPRNSPTEKRWIRFYEEEVSKNSDNSVFWDFFLNYTDPEDFSGDWVEEVDKKSYLTFCNKYQG